MTKSIRWAPFALLLTAAAPVAGPVSRGAVPLGPVALAPQPGSPLEATAREVAGADIADGGAGALLLVGSHSLGSAGTGPALFVQVQSDRACGSAGCSVSIYLPTKTGWKKVLDAVGTIVVQPAMHRGMHDLVVDRGDRWVWTGTRYTDTLPAPQVDLRPRHAPVKHHPTKKPSPHRP